MAARLIVAAAAFHPHPILYPHPLRPPLRPPDSRPWPDGGPCSALPASVGTWEQMASSRCRPLSDRRRPSLASDGLGWVDATSCQFSILPSQVPKSRELQQQQCNKIRKLCSTNLAVLLSPLVGSEKANFPAGSLPLLMPKHHPCQNCAVSRPSLKHSRYEIHIEVGR